MRGRRRALGRQKGHELGGVGTQEAVEFGSAAQAGGAVPEGDLAVKFDVDFEGAMGVVLLAGEGQVEGEAAEGDGVIVGDDPRITQGQDAPQFGGGWSGLIGGGPPGSA